MVQPGRRDLHQATRQFGNCGMRRAKERRVRKSPELLGNGRVDRGNAMAQQVAPQRRGPVEQPAAPIVDEIVALRANDDDRFARQIFLHLRERMPDVVCIPPPDVFTCRRACRTWGLTPAGRHSRIH